jgi:hypothetical protein
MPSASQFMQTILNSGLGTGARSNCAFMLVILFSSKQSRQAEYDRLTALPWWVRMGTISGAMTLSLSHDPATKLAR